MLAGNDKHAKGSMTHIGPGCSFQGNIDVPHDLFIYGDFTGNIVCKGNISLGTKATITGNINAKSAVIGGKIEGDLICSGTIELESSAQLIGDLSARELIIHKGAQFRGKSSMGESEGN